MAGILPVITGATVARSGATIMARIRGANGQLITRASMSTIAYVVSDLTAGTTGSSSSLVVASVVFNSLQQDDPRYTQDNECNPGPDGEWGYNFMTVIPASAFAISVLDSTADDPVPEPHDYQIDVVFTPVSGEPFRVVWLVTPVNVYA